MIYSKEELELINKLYDEKKNREEIAARCNNTFHSGRPIRTTKSIEFSLREKLKRSNDRFEIVCEVCKTPFRSGWPNARYCGEECRAVINREYATKVYRLDPRTNIQQQSIRARNRISSRWDIILKKFGNKCGKCKRKYPRIVYDLHHINGKRSRRETPARIIRGGTEEAFQILLSETELLCANCHRLHHAETGMWAPMRERQ
jgi:hypothetical protein